MNRVCIPFNVVLTNAAALVDLQAYGNRPIQASHIKKLR